MRQARRTFEASGWQRTKLSAGQPPSDQPPSPAPLIYLLIKRLQLVLLIFLLPRLSKSVGGFQVAKPGSFFAFDARSPPLAPCHICLLITNVLWHCQHVLRIINELLSSLRFVGLRVCASVLS